MARIKETFDKLVEASLAALHLCRVYTRSISAALVRKWASRGKITARGQRGKAKLYSLAEIQEYAEQLYGRPRAGVPARA